MVDTVEGEKVLVNINLIKEIGYWRYVFVFLLKLNLDSCINILNKISRKIVIGLNLCKNVILFYWTIRTFYAPVYKYSPFLILDFTLINTYFICQNHKLF